MTSFSRMEDDVILSALSSHLEHLNTALCEVEETKALSPEIVNYVCHELKEFVQQHISTHIVGSDRPLFISLGNLTIRVACRWLSLSNELVPVELFQILVSMFDCDALFFSSDTATLVDNKRPEDKNSKPYSNSWCHSATQHKKAVSRFFIDFISRFGSEEGFGCLIGVMNAVQLEFDSLCLIVKLIFSMSNYFGSFAQEYLPRFQTAVCLCLVNLAVMAVDCFPENELSSLFHQLEAIMVAHCPVADAIERIEQCQLDLCLTCMSSEQLLKRVQGLKSLNEFIENTSKRSVQSISDSCVASTRFVDNKFLSKWVTKNKVIDVIFVEMHPKLLKRIKNLLLLLISADKFEDKHMKILFSYIGSNEQETRIVFDIILSVLCTTLSIPQTQCMSSMLSSLAESDPSLFDVSFVKLLTQVTHIALQRQSQTSSKHFRFALPVLYSGLQNHNLPSQVRDLCLKYCAEILCSNYGLQHRAEYLTACLDSVQSGQSVRYSLRLACNVLSTFPKVGWQSSNQCSPSSITLDLEKSRALLEALLDFLPCHVSAADDVLKCMDFALSNSSLYLSIQDVSRLRSVLPINLFASWLTRSLDMKRLESSVLSSTAIVEVFEMLQQILPAEFNMDTFECFKSFLLFCNAKKGALTLNISKLSVLQADVKGLPSLWQVFVPSCLLCIYLHQYLSTELVTKREDFDRRYVKSCLKHLNVADNSIRIRSIRALKLYVDHQSIDESKGKPLDLRIELGSGIPQFLRFYERNSIGSVRTELSQRFQQNRDIVDIRYNDCSLLDDGESLIVAVGGPCDGITLSVAVVDKPLPICRCQKPSIVFSSYAPMLVDDQEVFVKLFDLLDLDNLPLADATWNLLNILPRGSCIVQAIRSSIPIWNEVLPAKCPLQLMYSLNVLHWLVCNQQSKTTNNDIVKVLRKANFLQYLVPLLLSFQPSAACPLPVYLRVLLPLLQVLRALTSEIPLDNMSLLFSYCIDLISVSVSASLDSNQTQGLSGFFFCSPHDVLAETFLLCIELIAVDATLVKLLYDNTNALSSIASGLTHPKYPSVRIVLSRCVWRLCEICLPCNIEVAQPREVITRHLFLSLKNLPSHSLEYFKLLQDLISEQPVQAFDCAIPDHTLDIVVDLIVSYNPKQELDNSLRDLLGLARVLLIKMPHKKPFLPALVTELYLFALPNDNQVTTSLSKCKSNACRNNAMALLKELVSGCDSNLSQLLQHVTSSNIDHSSDEWQDIISRDFVT